MVAITVEKDTEDVAVSVASDCGLVTNNFDSQNDNDLQRHDLSADDAYPESRVAHSFPPVALIQELILNDENTMNLLLDTSLGSKMPRTIKHKRLPLLWPICG